jgi:hypothetical protein
VKVSSLRFVSNIEDDYREIKVSLFGVKAHPQFAKKMDAECRFRCVVVSQ